MLARARALSIALACVLLLSAAPTQAIAADGAGAQMTADLEGKAIALDQVSRYWCEDFDAPRIHCFSSPQSLEARVAMEATASAVDYVVVFDFPTWAGTYMYMSQDYTILALVGWNDKISSIGLPSSSPGPECQRQP